MEQVEKPFLGLQAVGAGRRGLAFLSAGGPHEGGVADDARRTMLVTLLRSYRRTVGTPGETDGLERGTIAYRYALMPFAGALPRAEALIELAKLQNGLITRQTGRFSSGFPAMQGKAKPQASFIEQRRGSLVVSAVKPPEKGTGLVVRLWNPTGRPQTETLTFWRRVRRAALVQLNEDGADGRKPTVRGNAVTVAAKPHQIVTLRLEFA
jgi:alpha-mannosidase